MGATGHTTNKEFRKTVDIRKKMKQGAIQKNNIFSENFGYLFLGIFAIYIFF